MPSTTQRLGQRVPFRSNQYSVTEQHHVIKPGKQGIPGIYFKFDIESIGVSVKEEVCASLQPHAYTHTHTHTCSCCFLLFLAVFCVLCSVCLCVCVSVCVLCVCCSIRCLPTPPPFPEPQHPRFIPLLIRLCGIVGGITAASGACAAPQLWAEATERQRHACRGTHTDVQVHMHVGNHTHTQSHRHAHGQTCTQTDTHASATKRPHLPLICCTGMLHSFAGWLKRAVFSGSAAAAPSTS